MPTPAVHPHRQHKPATEPAPTAHSPTQAAHESGAPAGLPLFLQRAPEPSPSPVPQSEAPTLPAAPGTRVAVSPPGDRLEQEADAVAAWVQQASSPRPASSPPPHPPSEPVPSLKPTSPGMPLAPALRSRLEEALEADLSRVRIHADPLARATAHTLQARAFTHQNHIWLGQDQSPNDARLLAHEATHVVQQTTRADARPRPQPTAMPAASPPQPRPQVSRGHSTASNPSRPMVQRENGSHSTAEESSIPRTERASLREACSTIYMELNIGGLSDRKVDRVLRTLLLQQDRIGALRETYSERYHRPLETDLLHMSRADQLRAHEYMEHGRLTPVAKILLALDGAGTSHELLWRVIPDAHAEGDPFGKWTQLVQKPLAICSRWSSTSLNQAFASDLSAGDLDRARALARFGQLRPVDKIRVATNQAGTDEPMLFEGLRAADASTIHSQYQSEYHENLEEMLFDEYDDEGNLIRVGELSGGDADRARALLGATSANAAGLANIVQSALSGLNDTELLFGAVRDALERSRGEGASATAARAQLDHLRARIPTSSTSSDPLGLTSVGGLSDGELAQLKALLDIPETSTEVAGGQYASLERLNDPLVRRLRALGGVDSSSTYATLLRAGPADIRAFRPGYNETSSYFHRYLWSNVLLNNGDWGRLETILNGTFYQRLRLCAGTGLRDDYEDYAYHLLDRFTNPEILQELRAALRQFDRTGSFPDTDAGRALGALDGAFSSSEMSQVRNRIRGGTPEGGAALVMASEDLEADVEHERSWWFGPTADLNDERREVATAVHRAGLDARLSAAEEATLSEGVRHAREALQAYVRIRDEVTGYVAQVVQTAAGLLATLATGGTAGPLVAAALVRAAVASALARALTEKALRGDRFDLLGGDGARAFTSGAVDGVMNCLTVVPAASVLSRITRTNVITALERGTASTGLRLANGMLEGTMSGGVGGAVETVMDENAWRQGASDGLLNLLNATLTGSGTGAVTSAGFTAVASTPRIARSLRSRLAARHIDVPEPEPPHAPPAEGPAPGPAPSAHITAPTPEAHAVAPPAAEPTLRFTDPLVTLARQGDDAACAEILRGFGRWETAISHLRNRTGAIAEFPEGLPDELVRQLVAHRNRIRDHLAETFEARPQSGASAEPGSDLDFNVGGDRAGENLINARAWLDANHPQWEGLYRMALMIDASRIQTVSEHLASLPAAERARIEARVTRDSELFLFARRLRAEPEAQRATLLETLSNAEDRVRAESIANMGDTARRQAHDRALLEGDRLSARLNDPTLDPAERARIAGEITYQQMLANALGDEAYVSPGGVRGFAQRLELTSPHQRYQAALDQVGMLLHQIHAAGSPLRALRTYEFFKYVNRLCQVLEAEGIESPQITLLHNFSELIYRVDRPATAATGPRTVRASDLATSAPEAGVAYSDIGAPLRGGGEVSVEVSNVPDDILLNTYQALRDTIDQHLPALRRHALGDSAAATDSSRPGLLPRLPAPDAAPTPSHATSDPSTPATGSPAAVTPAAATPRTGLLSEDAMMRVVDAVDRTQLTLDPHAPIATHVQAVFDVVAQEFSRLGAPPPRLVVRDLGSPNNHGSYNAATHTLTVNSHARIGGHRSPLAFDVAADPVAYQRLLNLIYHECRHAEQSFRAAQFAIDQRVHAEGVADIPMAWNLAADEVATSMGIDPDVAFAAARRRLPPGDSAERTLGAEIYAERFGDAARARRRSAAQRGAVRTARLLSRARTALDNAEARVRAIPWYNILARLRESRIREHIAELNTRINHLQAEFRNHYEVYRNLFEEIDARAAGESIEALLRRRQELRTEFDATLTRETEAWRTLEIVRRWLPDDTMTELENAHRAQQATREALDRLIRTLPDDPLEVRSETRSPSR